MNNHKSRIEQIHGIEYHVLDFSNLISNDKKTLEKFINKNKYVKLIKRNIDILEFYYKNGVLHNDIGPAMVYINVKNNNIESKEYYLNGNKILENDWKKHYRKYKLLKLKDYNDNLLI